MFTKSSNNMKRLFKNFTLVFVFVFAIFPAQTHRFIYEVHYKSDSLSPDLRKENMNLDVNPTQVKFYPYAYAQMDSLNKVRNNRSIMWDDELPALVRKRNSDENTSFVLVDSFYSIKTLDKINWKLSEETKTEGTYKLQKATTNFGGRHWTAWFCREINLNEGPYKFRGLPGLIFEISDDKNNYLFKLSKSQKFPKTYETREFVETFGGEKPLEVNQKILNKKYLEVYNDPLHDIMETFKKNDNPENTFWVNGIQIKSLDQIKELTEMRQKEIIKKNNPIEVDKIIHYPLLKKKA